MKKKMTVLGMVFLLGALMFSGCNTPPEAETVGIPNPASAYCEEQGYTSEIRTDADGNQYGVCIFPDGAECDEWAFYRGECLPDVLYTESPEDLEEMLSGGGTAVEGWLGYVASTPDGAQFDDYVVFAPEDAGEVGIEGATSEIAAEIVSMRDAVEPGKYANFWGTLTCDVPDYNGCQLLVTRIRRGATSTEAEPIAGIEGTIISNEPGAQFDDYLILSGDFPVGYGIESLDPDLQTQLESLRDTGTIIRVSGKLRTGIPDAFGSQIEIDRLEIVSTP